MTKTLQTKKIAFFVEAYAFLSNFYVEPDGTHVEGEYQIAKCAKASDKARFAKLGPGQAKRLGNQIKLRPDWAEVRIKIMTDLVMKKFKDHPSLATALLMTGDAEIEEGNWWNDRFWGVCDGVGENHLGKILMKVREEIDYEVASRDKLPSPREQMRYGITHGPDNDNCLICGKETCNCWRNVK